LPDETPALPDLAFTNRFVQPSVAPKFGGYLGAVKGDSGTTVTGAPSPPTRILRARKSWLAADPRELWEFRGLMLRFAARDLTLRYRQTALGVVWVILQPLLAAGILAFVFGNVADLPAPDGIPYFLFTLVGTVGWTAFSLVATRSSGSLVANAPLVQKVFFPRVLLPISTACSTMVDLAVSLCLFAAVLVVQGAHSGVGIITFPIWLAMFVTLGLGLGLASCSLNVRFRDVGYVLPVLVQFLLFLSPVAYTLDAVPASARTLYELNPLAGLLEGLRWSLLGTPRPSLGLSLYSISVSIVVFVFGFLLFHRLEREFADVI
jgi:lipopolysaccharide transport system permease protein